MPHPKEILKTLGAAPLRAFSQNFLTSPHWPEKLAAALTEHSTADEFWEIGPGLGALTESLVKAISKPITLFEFDRKLAAYLRGVFPSLTLIEGDVLEADFTDLSTGKRIGVLSNLPYHLSSPILFKLASIRNRTERLILTFQREFAERIKAKVGAESYGGLSIICQLNFNIESIGILGRSQFYPEPSIDSEALCLTATSTSQDTIEAVVPIVKAAFLHPRKKMVNNLKGVFPTIDWNARMEKIRKGENTRAEELSLDEFINISS